MRYFRFRAAEAETQLASHRMRDADNKMTWDRTDSRSAAKLTGDTKIAGNHQEWNLQVAGAGKVTTDTGSLECNQ
jgi:hypothetical protein